MVVLFDFDEVFVDLNTGAINYINEKLGSNYSTKDITSWEFYDHPAIRAPFFEYLSLPDVYQKHVIAHEHMINLLKQMVEMGKKCYIVTASVESSEQSKYKFIKENMSFFDTKNLFTVNSSSKYKQKSDVLDELNLNYNEPIVLIDDGIHNILDMMADINHKDRLDETMKKFYINKTLKKFNNPYHEFIYGIVPELPYNKDIVERGRIYKFDKSKNIWNIFDKINEQHKVRVENKRAELFNYLNNIINDILPAEDFKQANELQNNVSYVTKTVLNKTNKNAGFLSDITRFSVKIDQILTTTTANSKLKKSELKKFQKELIESIFASADKKFGTDVMYNEVKSLVVLTTAQDELPEIAKKGKLIAENYCINDKQQDFFSTSTLKMIIDISKENMKACNNILQNNAVNQETIKELLHNAGLAYEIDYNDKTSLRANIMLAFNKNYIFDEETNCLKIKDESIENIRKNFLKISKAIKPGKH